MSKNSKKILQYLADNPDSNMNINQLSRFLDISVGSVHIILKEFEREGVVISEPVGNSITYKLNFTNVGAQKLLGELKMSESQNYLKKTKLVCTIGPSCNDVATIRKMIEKGMNVARINASHCDEEEILAIIKVVRKADEYIPILLDIPGIRIRVGKLKESISFKRGDMLKFCSNEKGGCIPIDYKDLHTKVSKDVGFSIDDGSIGFRVENVDGDIISCTALNDGVIRSKKGINIPGLNLGEEHLTENDKKLIRFAVKNKINFLGVSFVKSSEQIEHINELISDKYLKIISKVETKEAIEHYPEIIDKSYGVMIDRGDLGAEIGLERIPRLQKRIIEECNKQGKPVIVATQMLDSMIHSPYPTKSEITDVANAVLDGASALMLSAETAVGKYPVETVLTMSNIVSDIENDVKYKIFEDDIKHDDFTSVIGTSVANITEKIKVDKIITMTSGGYSARMLARHRLSTPVVAVTNNPEIVSVAHLMWGVTPILVNADIDNSGSVEQKKKVVQECLNSGVIRKEDTILLLGAVFPNNRKITNMIEVHKVHEFLGYFEGLEKND